MDRLIAVLGLAVSVATLARHGLPAMVAGSLACFMTACVAAILP